MRLDDLASRKMTSLSTVKVSTKGAGFYSTADKQLRINYRSLCDTNFSQQVNDCFISQKVHAWKLYIFVLTGLCSRKKSYSLESICYENNMFSDVMPYLWAVVIWDWWRCHELSGRFVYPCQLTDNCYEYKCSYPRGYICSLYK